MNSKPKSIQLDFELFLAMVSYISNHIDPYDDSIRDIITGIQSKLLAMERRDNFTLFRMGENAPDLSDSMAEYLSLLSNLQLIRL